MIALPKGSLHQKPLGMQNIKSNGRNSGGLVTKMGYRLVKEIFGISVNNNDRDSIETINNYSFLFLFIFDPFKIMIFSIFRPCSRFKMVVISG